MMGLRPIDLQIMLTQMTEVGRKESIRQKRRSVEEISREKKIKEKAAEQIEGVSEIEKLEVDSNAIHSARKIGSEDKGKKKHHEEDLKKKKSAAPLDEHKGNFLDITE